MPRLAEEVSLSFSFQGLAPGYAGRPTSFAVACPSACISKLKPEFCANPDTVPASNKEPRAVTSTGKPNRWLTRKFSFTRTEENTTPRRRKFLAAGCPIHSTVSSWNGWETTTHLSNLRLDRLLRGRLGFRWLCSVCPEERRPAQ